MNYSSNRGFPAGNPIANALVIVVGALAIGASIVLGFFAFIVLACLLLIVASVVGIRLWWFNRKLSKAARRQGDSAQKPHGVTVIEGEYRVVDPARSDNKPQD